MLEGIRGLKGYLWRKMEEQPKEKIEPMRFILPLVEFVDLPPLTEQNKIDVKYKLIGDFANAHIKWDPVEKQVIYILEEPELSEKEKEDLKKISSALIDMIEVRLTAIKSAPDVMKYLEEQIQKVMKETVIFLSQEQYMKIAYYIYRDFIGLNEIEPMLRDPWLEDIGCDGIGVPIYVIHRKYGSIKTNVAYKNLEDLRDFVVKLSERCGRYVSYAEPILDGTLPDGSRVSATLAGDVATRGPTFSIRKFAERPYSPVELIELGTIPSTIMAYFWYLVESGASILIAGGVATGKTTFLNSISMFIPTEAKIVSIEDTRELRIPNEHWISSVTRTGFGIPMSTGEKYGEITLFDLLRGSFRQNPDYVIVGEVRGKEAYVMFQGMSSGHPCMSTFHAGSVDAVIKRLSTPPIELSPSLVESLDAVVIMIHAKEKGKSARRIKEVEEIISVESENFKTFKSIEWDPKDDTYKFDQDSYLLKKIARNKGISLDFIQKEILRRDSILKWMLNNGIKDYVEFCKIVNEYYKDPQKILKQVGTMPLTEVKNVKTEEVKPTKVEKKPIETEKPVLEKPKKVSITEIFGFKVLSEK